MIRKTLAFSGLFALATFSLVFSPPAQAGEPRLKSTFGAWNTYTFDEDGSQVCFMAAKVKLSEAEAKKRGVPYAVITHRPGDGTRNVFSYIAGYDYKSGSDVSVEVNGQRFVLFTQGGTAWTPDPDSDSKLAKAITSGTDMVVTGTSARGTKTIDRISLAGSTSAHDDIDDACY